MTDNFETVSFSLPEGEDGAKNNATGATPPPPGPAPTGAVGQYHLYDILGKGNFGHVFRGKHAQDGSVWAIKKVTTDHAKMSQRQKDLLYREMEYWKLFKHPNIVMLREVLNQKQHTYFVMEYLPGGNLEQLMDTFPNRQIPEDRAKFLFMQVLSAIAHCHAKKVELSDGSLATMIHRDIKPANILLTEDHKTAKVTDFGLCNLQPEGQLLMTAQCGTPYYMSYEMFLGNYEGQPADCWALGVMLYEMFAGERAFGRAGMNLHKHIKARKVTVALPKNISTEARDLLSRLMDVDPKRRLTAAGALSHRWFGNNIPKPIDPKDQADVVEAKQQPATAAATAPTAPAETASPERESPASLQPIVTMHKIPHVAKCIHDLIRDEHERSNAGMEWTGVYRQGAQLAKCRVVAKPAAGMKGALVLNPQHLSGPQNLAQKFHSELVKRLEEPADDEEEA